MPIPPQVQKGGTEAEVNYKLWNTRMKLQELSEKRERALKIWRMEEESLTRIINELIEEQRRLGGTNGEEEPVRATEAG